MLRIDVVLVYGEMLQYVIQNFVDEEHVMHLASEKFGVGNRVLRLRRLVAVCCRNAAWSW